MWVGAGVWNAVPSEGGDGLKVILIRFTTQTRRKDKAALSLQCLLRRAACAQNDG